MPTLKMEGSMFLIAEMPDGVVLSFFFSVEVGAAWYRSKNTTVSVKMPPRRREGRGVRVPVGVSGSARPEEGAGEYGIGRDVGVGGGE
jgi:hypothetical protein